jgi:hypothetical protein
VTGTFDPTVGSFPPAGGGGTGQRASAPPDLFAVANSAPGDTSSIDLSNLALVGELQWLVPSFALAFPGLLLILIIVVQATGGIIWLPAIRRYLGGFGLRQKRSTSDR